MGDVTLSVAIDSGPAQSGAAAVRAEIDALTAKVTSMISAFDGAGTQMAAALSAISSSTGGAVLAIGNLDAAAKAAAGAAGQMAPALDGATSAHDRLRLASAATGQATNGLGQQLDDTSQHAEKLKQALSSGGGSQMGQWRQDLAEQQKTLAQEHAADATYHAQALQLTASFWASKANAARSGSAEQLAAAKAESEAEKQLYQQQATEAAQVKKEQANTATQISKIRLEEEKVNLNAEVAAGTISQQEKFTALTAFENRKFTIDDDILAHEMVSLKEGTPAWQQAYDKRLILAEQHKRQLAQIGKQETAERNAEVKAWEAPVVSAMNTMVAGYMQGTQKLSQVAAKAAQSIAISYAQKGVGMAADWLHTHVVMAAYDELFSKKEITEKTATEAAKKTITVAGQTAQTTATTTGVQARTAAEAAGNTSFIGRIGEQLAKWLGLETAKTGGTVAGETARSAETEIGAATRTGVEAIQTTESVGLSAARGAAGTYADACEEIPYGWLVGAGLAAVSFAAIKAFSSFGGEGEVPYDGALYQLHAKETVLPADIAVPLRSALRSGGLTSAASGVALPASLSNAANSNAQAAPSQQIAANGGGGDTHVHFNVSAIDSKGVDGFFKQHGPKIAKTVRDQARNFSVSAQTTGKK